MSGKRLVGLAGLICLAVLSPSAAVFLMTVVLFRVLTRLNKIQGDNAALLAMTAAALMQQDLGRGEPGAGVAGEHTSGPDPSPAPGVPVNVRVSPGPRGMEGVPHGE